MNALEAAQELQRRASHPASHVWVSASAGSGKTTVLVARLLRLLLGDDQTPATPPHRILCLTYTKAAAMEMRVRLEQILSQWATIEVTTLEQRLHQLTGTPPTQKMIARARALFANISDRPEGMRIQTIHAFCQSILARFPIEAGIAPGFTALDEYQAAPLLARALEQAWHDEPTSAWNATKSWLEGRYSINTLHGILSNLLRAWPDIAPAVAQAGGEDGYWRACFAALKVPEDPDTLWLEIFSDENLPLEFLRDWSDCAPNEKLVAFLHAAPPERAVQREHYLQLFLTQDYEPRKKLFLKAIAEKLSAQNIATAHAEQERLLRVLDKIKDQKLALASAAVGLLTARVSTTYTAMKAAQNTLDFSDLITRTRDLLMLPGMGEWVHYRLDGGIDHILVDEAQDTAPEQWQIIRTLAAEFFAGLSHPDWSRSLFVVGDPKQSIYSFQGANADLFHALEIDFTARAETAQMEFARIPLSHSFRTAANVLTLVDDVFVAPSQQRALHGTEQSIQHFSIHENRIGTVRVYPTIAAQPRSKPQGLMIVERETEASHNARLAVQIARTIADWLAEGRMLSGENRHLRASDILILLQQRTTLADQLLHALRTAGVPAAGNDRLQLLDATAVQDLLCFCQFLLLPTDDLNLAQLLRSPFINMDELTLGDIAATRQKDETLWHAVSMHSSAAYLYDWLARADYESAYDTLAAILSLPCPAANSGLQALHARLGQQCDDPVNELLQLALREGGVGEPLGLQAFMAWIQGSVIEIKRDLSRGQDNAVRILTVHGAKGLEAPIVILADASEMPHEHGSKRERAVTGAAPMPHFLFAPDRNFESPSFNRSAVDAARRDEYQRLLYVALTRTSHELHIFGKANAKGERRTGNWYDQILSALQRREDAWADENDIWHYGAEDRFADDVIVETIAKAINPWLENLSPVPPPNLAQPVAVTELSERGVAIQARGVADPAAQQRGVVLHRLLELLPDLPIEDRVTVAENFLQRQMPSQSVATHQSWIAEVMRVLHAPETAEFFSPYARAEAAVSGWFEGHPVIGTVDRFYMTDKELGILDFKTGVPPADGKMPAAYQRQLQIYAKILSEIYPGRELKIGILWTQIPRWQELEKESLALAA